MLRFQFDGTPDAHRKRAPTSSSQPRRPVREVITDGVQPLPVPVCPFPNTAAPPVDASPLKSPLHNGTPGNESAPFHDVAARPAAG